MRPQYETESDIERENKVKEFLSSHWRCMFEKLPISYRIDYVAVVGGDKIMSWVEIKCRKIASDDFPTLFLSAGKWLAGLSLRDYTGLPFVLVYALQDKLCYLKVVKDFNEVEFKWGGRTIKTRDSADIEPMVHIPVNCFKEIEGFITGGGHQPTANSISPHD